MTDKGLTDARRAWRAMSELVLADDRKELVSEELGLSFARIRTLRRLAPEPHTLRELSSALSADPPYVTLMVDDLEDRGLVERKPHPKDRRAKLVTLTPKGRKFAVRAEEILDTPPKALGELPKSAIKALLKILDQMTQ